jgi:hypothetical protein
MTSFMKNNSMSSEFRRITDFAKKHYTRREWSSELIDKLMARTYWDSGRNTLIRVTDAATGDLAATMVLTRAPFGSRRVFERKPDGSETALNSEVGAWGVGVHLLSLRNPFIAFQLPHRAYKWARRVGQPGSPEFFELPMETKFPKRDRHGLESSERVLAVKADGSQIIEAWGDGELIEPRLFVVEKSKSIEAKALLISQVIGFVLDPRFSKEFNLKHRVLHTYNDLPKLYTMIGFKDTGEVPQVIDGKKYYALSANVEDLLAMQKRIAQALTEKGNPYLAHVIQAFENL